MIFLATTLVMNGGTTFLLRMAKEYDRRGTRCAILLMTGRVDSDLMSELAFYADILPLADFLRDRGKFARGLLGAFAPLRQRALCKALEPYGLHIHAMGLFGLILGLRLAQNAKFELTAGIYHQNEFLYRPPPFYFAQEGQRIFSALPAANVIFFNETSRENYAKFFQRDDYLASALLPIGVSLEQPPLDREIIGTRIISIGNLVEFKTYNRHMIGIVAALKKQLPDISYDIYGTGPMERDLRDLARTLEVDDRITLHGAISYDRLRSVVADSDLFVGSGTALIEAAAVGRPAMIGIESIKEPETYGFLSDVDGFSYNENIGGISKVSMEPLVLEIFSNQARWRQVAEACRKKSLGFSVGVTADGFENVAAETLPPSQKLSRWQVFRLASSAVAMALIEKCTPGQSFGDRRNQSFERSH